MVDCRGLCLESGLTVILISGRLLLGMRLDGGLLRLASDLLRRLLILRVLLNLLILGRLLVLRGLLVLLGRGCHVATAGCVCGGIDVFVNAGEALLEFDDALADVATDVGEALAEDEDAEDDEDDEFHGSDAVKKGQGRHCCSFQ